MSIENITANILKDAENLANESIKNAEKIGQDVIDKANNEAQAIIKTESEKAEKEAVSLKNRKVSAAELQGRKMILSAKQEAIKKSFDVALEKLVSMPEDEYVDFMANQIAKIPYNEGIIFLNMQDKKKIGEKLVKTVNEKYKTGKYVLSNETINSRGGFVLKNGNIEVNSTFETMIDSIKDELTNKVAETLFN